MKNDFNKLYKGPLSDTEREQGINKVFSTLIKVGDRRRMAKADNTGDFLKFLAGR